MLDKRPVEAELDTDLLAPWIIFTPGVVLAATVLAINLMGDGLRDALDPKLKRS